MIGWLVGSCGSEDVECLGEVAGTPDLETGLVVGEVVGGCHEDVGSGVVGGVEQVG